MSRRAADTPALGAMVAAPLLALAALACGGAATPLGGDAAAPDAAADVGAVPATCELVTQAGCSAAQQCSLFCDPDRLVIACRAEPANAPLMGEPCMNVPCTRGTTCLATAGRSASCMKLCNASADCPQGQVCRDINVTYGCATMGPPSVVVKACL
jgi:hypothetical protein